MSSLCPRMPGSSWDRWTSPMSTSSTVCPRRSPSTRRQRHATPGPRWGRSPRSTTISVFSTPESGSHTVPGTGRRWSDRPRNRSWTGSSNWRTGPGSRCWPRWSGVARASSRGCWRTWPRKGSPGRVWTGRSGSSPRRSSSTATTSTPSRWWWTVWCEKTGWSNDSPSRWRPLSP